MPLGRGLWVVGMHHNQISGSVLALAGTTLTRAVPPSPLSDGEAKALTRAGSAVALLLLRLLRRDEAVQLKVPFRNSNYISRQDWNRCRYGVVAHAGLAAPLDLNCIAACSICGAASDGECGEDVEPTLVRIFAGFRDLTHHVKGPKRRNGNRYFWVSQIFAAEFLSERLFKFGLSQTDRVYSSGER